MTEETHDVDDWLTVIATGRCAGMTGEATADRYPRPRDGFGVRYRTPNPSRTADPVAGRPASGSPGGDRAARRPVPGD